MDWDYIREKTVGGLVVIGLGTWLFSSVTDWHLFLLIFIAVMLAFNLYDRAR